MEREGVLEDLGVAGQGDDEAVDSVVAERRVNSPREGASRVDNTGCEIGE